MCFSATFALAIIRLTRARKLAIVIGPRATITQATRAQQSFFTARNSYLLQRLQDAVKRRELGVAGQLRDQHGRKLPARVTKPDADDPFVLEQLTAEADRARPSA